MQNGSPPQQAPYEQLRDEYNDSTHAAGVIGRAGVGTIIGHDTCSGILGTKEGQDGMPLESR